MNYSTSEMETKIKDLAKKLNYDCNLKKCREELEKANIVHCDNRSGGFNTIIFLSGETTMWTGNTFSEDIYIKVSDWDSMGDADADNPDEKTEEQKQKEYKENVQDIVEYYLNEEREYGGLYITMLDSFLEQLEKAEEQAEQY